jgi:hypothetical protein
MDDIKKYSHDPLLKVKNPPPMIPSTAVKTVAFLAAVRKCGYDLPSLYEVLSYEVHCYPSWSGDLISFFTRMTCRRRRLVLLNILLALCRSLCLNADDGSIDRNPEQPKLVSNFFFRASFPPIASARLLK